MKGLGTFGYGTRTQFKLIFSLFLQMLVRLCNITILRMKLHMVILWYVISVHCPVCIGLRYNKVTPF